MKKNILILSVAALALTSCDDFLNKTPLDKQSAETYFKTETELQLFSNNFYSSPYTVKANDAIFQEQNDLIFQTGSLASELKGGTNRTVPASGGGWNWSILRKINTLLDHIDQCQDEGARVKYTAIARYFRGSFYFEKVKRFGDVPWYEHELTSDSPELYRPRDSREFIVDKIIEDLDYAAENLSETPDQFRVNKWTALALKSNVCLFEGTWRKYHTEDETEYAHEYSYYLEQCAEAAKAVIEGGRYSLESAGTTPYLDVFKAENASQREFIFAIHYDGALEVTHSRGFNAIQMGGQTISRKAVNMYLMKDGTRYTDQSGWQTKEFAAQVSDRDPRLAQTIVTPGYVHLGIKSGIEYPKFSFANSGYQSIKFLMDFGDASRNDLVASDGKSYNDMPVIRYSEVLLNYAEALAELGTLTQGDLDASIGVIRTRANMPGLDMAAANANPCAYLSDPKYGYVNITGANKGVILEIRRERAIELIQEGQGRWYDLMRWKEGKCIEQEMYGMYFPGPGEYDLNGDGVADHCIYKDVLPVTSCPITLKIGDSINLTDGDSGYVLPHSQQHFFNEGRDYLYPIPSNEIQLSNQNLKQNPGWTI